jgi:predicted dienelactone hydrolase
MLSHAALPRALTFSLLAAAPLCMAATELPAPTGPFAVGQTMTYAKDDDRPELWTDDPKDRRELPLMVWYPADADTTAPLADYSPYPPDKMRGALAVERGRGKVLVTHTHADPPLAKGINKFPVILFSPGGGSSPAAYHALIEDLASHGYIVVGMDHTYEGAGQVLGDGRLIPPTVENMRVEGDPKTEAFAQAVRAQYFRQVGERSKDAAMAITCLNMMNKMPKSKFANRLDLDRIGVLGHSIGGVGAAHALMDVPQIKAGVNLDGHAASMPFDEAHTPKKPFLCVEAPSLRPTDEKLAKWELTREKYDAMQRDTDQRQVAAYQKNPTVSYRVTINGAEHGSFSDETYPMPDKEGLAARRIQYTQAARTYILAFFDQTLLGKDSPVLKTVPADLAAIVQTEKFGGDQ